jgi:predicted RNase H-like HicB family nuclease
MIQSVQNGEDILLTDYIEGALRKARYEILSDDGSYYGEIPGFQGVYANASTLEECRHELKEVLEDWILLGISRHSPLPLIDGIDLKVREAV